ncbi:hypothetical protein N7466_010123 [Penicillium verhagenii]|uniref:uncharacterized protein n=1 Tax=Penicillium verhagenii TaxID=1562060 RepID=UPI002545B571|nr:uncharacterized protein N7466_010123 [Penicillium verhagenii]KAJ5919180.1 hypothetical protein N7466_010123 [Penicillium verhagenii]
MSAPPLSVFASVGRLKLSIPILKNLTRRYTGGDLSIWGNYKNLEGFFGPHNASITLKDQEIRPWGVNLVCLVGTGQTPAWVLHIIFTPDFLWLSLAPTPLTVEACLSKSVQSNRQFPIATSSIITSNRSIDESWMQLLDTFRQHFQASMKSGGSAIPSSKLGVPSPMATSDGHPEDIDMDRPWTPLTPGAAILSSSLSSPLSVIGGATRAHIQASPKNSKEGASNPFAQLKGSKEATPNPFAHLKGSKESASNPFAHIQTQPTVSKEASPNPFAQIKTQPKAPTPDPFAQIRDQPKG